MTTIVGGSLAQLTGPGATGGPHGVSLTGLCRFPSCHRRNFGSWSMATSGWNGSTPLCLPDSVISAPSSLCSLLSQGGQVQRRPRVGPPLHGLLWRRLFGDPVHRTEGGVHRGERTRPNAVREPSVQCAGGLERAGHATAWRWMCCECVV